MNMSPSKIMAGLIAVSFAAGSIVGVASPANAAKEVMNAVGSSHGKISTLTREAQASKRAAAAITSASNLQYRGGNHGIGVTTGPPKVVLVFWGTQWGTQTIDPVSNVSTFSNDPAGVAPRLQMMFSGLGTNNELWSGVQTQFCESGNNVTIAVGAQSCPANAPHVGYPLGGALQSVLYDNAAAAPTQATDNQIAGVAVRAATTVGNTTPARNRSTQYFVVSSSGLHPGGFNTLGANWCAWHDWNGDTTLVGGAYPSTVGDIAFTNMPYIPDQGASCGANYVNAGAAGNIDGVTIVGGHEFAETITDQNPGGGWIDSKGAENSDKCAWVGVGGTGGAQNLVTSAGTFAMQANWSNDVAGCQFTHAIVSTSSQVVAFSATTPNQSSVAGTPVTLQMSATSTPAGPTITYSATGLPTGLTIAPATGLISGTPTANVTNSAVVVTATDSGGSVGTSSFTWTVTGAATLPGLTPTFATPVATATGFTAKVSNHSTSYTWTCTATSGSCSVSTAGTVTVSGVAAGTSVTATVNTARTGYSSGTAAVSATSLLAAVNPTLSFVRTGTTLVVTITNYDGTFAYTQTSTRGTITRSLAVITVTGVTAGRTATVTVKNTKTGYAGGSASITG